MNTKNSEHDDSANPLGDSTTQDGSGQDSLLENSSPKRQSLGKQEKQTLRRKAEALVRAEETATKGALTPEETGRLLHELQVHEIELEIQNEELRQAQVELETSRAQYYDLYDLAPVSYLTLSEKGLILKANLTAATLFGVKREALVLKPLSHFILDEDQTLYYLHRKKLLETGAPLACELRMVKKDGTIFWVLLEATAAQDDAGSPFFFVTLSDITEQKRVEEDLQNSLTMYKAHIETTDTGFVILDRTGSVVDANEEYVRLSGHQHLGQILGRNVVEWTAGYEKEKNTEAVGQCLREGQIRHFEIDYVNAQGKITPIEINATVITVNGAPQILTLCRDITERNQAEDALRSSEARYRQLVENANEAILVIQDGMMKFANRMAGELAGYPLQVLAARPFPEFIHPDDREMVVERHLGRLKGDLSFPRYAFRLIVHDDFIKWVEISAVLIDWEGRPATLNFLTDITERKLAEDALRESETRFRTLAASAQDAIIMINERGDISFWNKAAQVIFGWSEDEILGKNLHDMIMPESYRAVFAGAFESFQSTGSGAAVGKITELEGLRKDGTGVPVELSLAAVQLGNSWQGIGIVRDITERKRSEDALREANSYLNNLIDHASAPIIVWDPTFRITRFNHAFETITGFSAPEVLGQEIGNLFPEDNRQESLGLIYATETGRLWESVEIPIQRKDGAIRMVLWNSATLYGPDNKTIIATIAQGVDITERVLISEELERHRLHLEELVIERTDQLDESNRILAKRAAELADSQRNFDRFFNTVDDLLFVLDPEGKMIHVNQTVCRRLGYSEAELIGQSILAVHPPGRQEEAGRIVAAMLAGQADYCPVPVMARDGTEIPVENRVVQGEWNGEPALFGVTKDVTKLKLSEEKFSRAFHSGAVLMAISTIAEGRYLDVNETFLRTFGFERDEVIGKTSGEIGIFDDPGVRADIISRMAKRGSIRNIEVDFHGKDGRIHQGLFSADPILVGDSSCLLTTMTDITDRKRVEEALNHSMSLIEATLDATDNGILVVSREGSIIKVNHRFKDLWHLPEDILATSDDEMLLNYVLDQLADPEAFLARIRELYSDPHTESVDQLHFKDGRVFERFSRPMRVAGEARGRVWSFRDITARIGAEKELQLQRDFAMQVVNTMGQGLTVTNAEGQFEFVNPAYAQLFGHSPADLVGKGPQDVTAPEDQEILAQQKAARRAGQTSTYDSRLHRLDGSLAEVQITAVPRLREGKYSGSIAVITDLTERKRAEENLKRAKTLLSASSQAVALLLRKADFEEALSESLNIVGAAIGADRSYLFRAHYGSHGAGWVSQQLEWNYGSSAPPRDQAELQNLPFSTFPDLIEPMLKGKVFSSLTRTSSDDLRALLETQGILSLIILPIMTDGVFWGAVGFDSCTEEREWNADDQAILFSFATSIGAAVQRADAETELREAKLVAEKATSAKSSFLANMSHEIRTPLNAILGFSQLMQRDPGLDLQQKERVEIINRSGEHLLALLNDILELSKIEAGQQILVRTLFDLHAMFDDLARTFRTQASAKNLTFHADGIETVLRYIIADEMKLRQVLVNLLANAVKFTSAGGVWMRAKVEEEKPAELRLVILVGDSGPGIAAPEMDRLFEAFEQTTAGRYSRSGTGLGLSISQRFARIMGGDVTVTSDVGKGSVFRLEIPIEAGTAAMVSGIVDDRRVLRLEGDQPGCRVLVVEDDQESRAFLVQMLGGAGFEVFEAANGSEAVEAFAIGRPQVILMDNRMPEMSGDEAIRQIRHSPGSAEVKIITVTANATGEIRNQTLAAGADDFLAKPFRAEELFEKLRLLTNVRYIYASTSQAEAIKPRTRPALTPEVETPKPLILPAKLKEQIREAAIRGGHDQLLSLIQQVAAIDAEMSGKLGDLVATFDYETLLQWLD